MGLFMVSEVTPFPGVTSDTETCLASQLLLIRFVQKFTKPFLYGLSYRWKKPQVETFIQRITKNANVSNPSEVTPVDGSPVEL